MENLSEMTFKELYALYCKVGWEITIRVWWLYSIIFAVILGCVIAEVLQQRRWKRNG